MSAGKATYNEGVIADSIVDRLAARLDRVLAPPHSVLRPWIVDGYAAGYLDDRRTKRIARFGDVFDVAPDAIHFQATLDDPAARTRAIDAVARTLAAEGALTRWRDERYSVAVDVKAPALFEIERAAARFFGIATHAAHINATTTRDGETRMWIARRSLAKPIDPGLLDNLVGGGIAAGASIADTVVKEAWEEAGIAGDVASSARPTGFVRIFREQPDGILRETIHVHDLSLTPDFEPRNQDGEVAGCRLASIDEVAAWMGNDTGDDVVTADAALVIADWLIRNGHLRAARPAYRLLDRLRSATV
jgi:8-oxo-dGTP pyrophosphatase MutT (NUDIX family)